MVVVICRQLLLEVAFAVALYFWFRLVHTVQPLDFSLVQLEFGDQHRIAHGTEQDDGGGEYGDGFSHGGKCKT